MANRGGDYDASKADNIDDHTIDDIDAEDEEEMDDEYVFELDESLDKFARCRRRCRRKWWPQKTNREIACGIAGAIIVLGILIALVILTLAAKADRYPMVILLSIDGYRWDYLHTDGYESDILNKLGKHGVLAELVPIFPSFPTPTHYTIVTGVFSKAHGITGEVFYNPETEMTFDSRDNTVTSQSIWWRVEPIWNLVKKAGMATAVSSDWPGATALIADLRPDIIINSTSSLEEQFSQLLAAVDCTPRPAFVAMRVSAIAVAAETFGPLSAQTREAIAQVNDALENFIVQIESEGRRSHLAANLIVLAPRGIAGINPNRSLLIDRLVNIDEITNYGIPGSVVTLWPESDQVDQIVTTLSSSSFRWTVYTNDSTFPSEWGYGGPTIGPVTIVADPGFIITTSELLNNDSTVTMHVGGSSGYAPDTDAMHGIFIGYGESFLTQETFGKLAEVEVMNLMCCILNVTCANSGTSPCIGGILTQETYNAAKQRHNKKEYHQ